ncbi:MAG: translation elongation factor Ts [Patescibacteria group bacterium]|nr:translation elongation factor Ts [Patescibacteria group bacterium]
MSTKDIVKLREMTGAGMMDCKKALEEADGDISKAVDVLRKKGVLKATKKGERTTGEGLVHAYIHTNGKVGALVQMLCETDFVARNEEFKKLTHDIAMQVTAMYPSYLAPEDVPANVVKKEKEIYLEKLGDKPADVKEKIIEGKLAKFYSEVCLLKQPFFKDEDVTIEELIQQKIIKIGENIKVKKFERFSF